MSTKNLGDACENAAIFYYTLKGYVVSRPVTHSKWYDLVIDDGKNLLRVECKSSTYKQNKTSYDVALASTGGNRSWDKISKFPDMNSTDLFFILDGDMNAYQFTAEELHNRRTVAVNPAIKQFLCRLVTEQEFRLDTQVA